MTIQEPITFQEAKSIARHFGLTLRKVRSGHCWKTRRIHSPSLAGMPSTCAAAGALLSTNISAKVPLRAAPHGFTYDQPCSCNSKIRTTPDFTTSACGMRGISLFSALRMFS